MTRKTDEFTVLDSGGTRRESSTGCARDDRTGRGRYDLLPVFALQRDAILYEKGVPKYAARNWEKGQPFSWCLDSAKRHIDKYLEGSRVEDNLAAARFHLASIMHYEEMIKRDLLPADLNDLPSYAPLLPSQVSAELAPVPIPPTCRCCHKRPSVMGRNVCSGCFGFRPAYETPSPDKDAPDEYVVAKCSECGRQFVSLPGGGTCSSCAFLRSTEHLVRGPTPSPDKET